jgi:hypothetical protein
MKAIHQSEQRKTELEKLDGLLQGLKEEEQEAKREALEFYEKIVKLKT